jgi:membrane protease YdiL (CAAX protease family)
VLLYLAAIAIGEVVLAFVSVESGLVIEAFVLVALVNHYTFSPQLDVRVRHALVVLGLIPLARLATFTLPQATLSIIYWEALIVFPILLGIAFTSELVDPKWLKFGLGRSPRWIQGLVVLASLALSLGLAHIGLKGTLEGNYDGALLGTAIVVVFLSGVTAEIMFRGLVQSALSSIFGRAGVGLTSAAFAIGFLGTGSAGHVLFAGALGLGYGMIVERTGSVIGVAVGHGMFNVGWHVVWPGVL